MKNQDSKNETYIGEDGLLYCAKCHTPCEKPSHILWRRASCGRYM